jgi:lipoprotein-anchoring transpeptidase ErfK/SrfK
MAKYDEEQDVMKFINKNLKTLIIGAFAAVIAMTAAVDNSAAQGFFGGLWGGSNRPLSRTTVDLKVPYRTGTIIVSIGDARLYKIQAGGKAISYPIAIPSGDAFWSGVEPVTRKAVNPRWTPTASMRKENPALPPFVKGGDPRNPLGVRALYLGSTLYRIHGTDAPQLIGRSVSRGCIRMYNEDVIDLYNRTSIGTKVIVTGKKFIASSALVAANDNGFDDSDFTQNN